MGQAVVKEVDERALGEVDWLVELGSVVAFLLFIWCTLISTALSLVCSTIITYPELPTIFKNVLAHSDAQWNSGICCLAGLHWIDITH